jgi:nitroreductase
MEALLLIHIICTGLATAPMEGYDGRRVLAALDVPDRYAVVIAIATGYEDDSKKPSKPSWRLPADEVMFSDRFGQQFQQQAHSTISATTATTSSSNSDNR